MTIVALAITLECLLGESPAPAATSGHPPSPPPAALRFVRRRIPRAHNISFAAFRRDYLIPSRPLIISGALDDWPAMAWADLAKLRYGWCARHSTMQ